jgi:PAS domain-containing protein
MGLHMGVNMDMLSVRLVLFGGMIVAVLWTCISIWRQKHAGPSADGIYVPSSEGPVFLFDGETMLDCNSAARAILTQSFVVGGDWQRLVGFLFRYFKNIDDKLNNLAKTGTFAETAQVGNGKMVLLQAELTGGLTKITLIDPDVTEGAGVSLAVAHRGLQDEVADLRHALGTAPLLVWRESEDGLITWANNAYILMAASNLKRGQNLGWPLPRLFDRSAVVQSANRQRQSVLQSGGKTAWFDLITQPDKDETLCFALPIDAAVAAENSLRDFMQTLSKTFAQLPIGLAIFDKDRKLQMFNPALVELTTLPADFLTRRPTMLAVLDAMRDRNRLPEPKDYQSWRRQIVEMERAAASGLFQENWALPDGQTFRVTGRPHPNGGLALMIEDISNEMQRSRRYRTDLEISQSVLDQMDEAIVVFNQTGQLMWCNTAYTRLWGHDPSGTMDEANVRNIAELWKLRTAPTQLWRELDDYVHTIGLRQPWSKEMRLKDGRLLICQVAPIAAGATMVAFKAPQVQGHGVNLALPKASPDKAAATKATAAR